MKEKLKDGTFLIGCVPSMLYLANILTKPFDGIVHERLRDIIGIISICTSLLATYDYPKRFPWANSIYDRLINNSE